MYNIRSAIRSKKQKQSPTCGLNTESRGKKRMDSKTRNAYIVHDNGKETFLFDTVERALKYNLTVKEFEKIMIRDNAGVTIIVRIEARRE